MTVVVTAREIDRTSPSKLTDVNSELDSVPTCSPGCVVIPLKDIAAVNEVASKDTEVIITIDMDVREAVKGERRPDSHQAKSVGKLCAIKRPALGVSVQSKAKSKFVD